MPLKLFLFITVIFYARVRRWIYGEKKEKEKEKTTKKAAKAAEDAVRISEDAAKEKEEAAKKEASAANITERTASRTEAVSLAKEESAAAKAEAVTVETTAVTNPTPEEATAIASPTYEEATLAAGTAAGVTDTTAVPRWAAGIPEAQIPLPGIIRGLMNGTREPSLQSCYDNRELSWLKFNARVLEEAEDEKNPFCERLSFASIFQSNLDEFFGVRIGSLYDEGQIAPDLRDNKTNLTCSEQIDAAFEQVKILSKRKDVCYAELKKGLETYGVEILSYAEMNAQDVQFLDAYFEHEISPLLSPQIIGKKQPFPFLKNKAIYAVVVLGKKGRDKLGIVPCSMEIFPRMVKIPDHPNRYMLMEELILHYIDRVFEQYEIKSKSLIRILRNADIDPDEEMYDDDADFRKIMEQLVNRRKKLCPIKLEYTRLMDQSVIDVLCQHLELQKKHVFHSEAPLDLSFFSKIRDILRNEKDLFYEKYSPRIPASIDMTRNIMQQVAEKDRLLFYPYESIQPFLILLNEAAYDPDVISIKMTLYRVANDSKVVEALIRAAENGKEVDVLVELRARFDEENNITWSRRLEDAGCRILYGLDKLKVHSKLCLITRKQAGGIFYYTQIGTGNYNEKTSRLYTDFSLMTAHQGIGAEANEVFTRLYLGHVMEETKYLLVAPKCLRGKVLDKIDRQIALAKEGKPAYVGAKMNSLTDKPIIDKLIEASQAGVKIEIICRGACCLIAGVPGFTENITVRSIVGRYLEHSRIYIFGAEDPEVYIASADFMTRNTTKRVEVAAPVYDDTLRDRILHIFRIQMEDNVKARIQQPDGTYVRAVQEGEPLISQQYFQTY